MARLKNIVAAGVAVLAIAASTVAAEANHRYYGYDRYGYHAPRYMRWHGPRYYGGWDYYPAYRAYPVYGYYAVPRFMPRYVEYMTYGRCWYDYGWYRLRRVCY